RTWDHKIQKPDIIQRVNLRSEVIRDILRKNVSLIAAGVAIKNEVLTEISVFFQRIIINVNSMGKTWDTSSLGEQGLFQATESYRKNKNLFEKATQFLKDIDLGLTNIAIQEGDAQNVETGEMRKIYRALGFHMVDGKEYQLPFAFESSGTKNMFVLLHFLLPAIEQGGIAVIDELEIDLHPHMLPCIIELFANPTTNPKNTQLLFTSHSLEILSHLEKEQIVLVEKNKDCKSGLFRLDEIKGVRRDDNIYAKYMAGAYGAVPNILPQ
ncbi:ATP-binding protein, partial [Candidatus Pacearchaeota archaeon]|nr:ATP-binding protein [Candidatus Pacearchaeota archaeon]